jgi:hypothetical protein
MNLYAFLFHDRAGLLPQERRRAEAAGGGASSFFEQAASMNGAATAMTSATFVLERCSICELL